MTLDRIFRLDGKRALITGASKGIGLGIAQALAAFGAHVTLCARDESALSEAVDTIKESGGEATYFSVDVTNVKAFSERIASQLAFDIFVNNAGTNRPKPLVEVTEDDYDAVLGLNVRAAVFAAQAVVNKMIADGKKGSVINISSQMGHVGAANRTLYCASKWAIEGFTKALAVELSPHGIRVNTLCPTFIKTPMTQPFLSEPGFFEEITKKIKLGRVGSVEDLAGGAVYLASDASSLVTGSALVIDGGWTAD